MKAKIVMSFTIVHLGPGSYDEMQISKERDSKTKHVLWTHKSLTCDEGWDWKAVQLLFHAITFGFISYEGILFGLMCLDFKPTLQCVMGFKL